MGTNSYIVRGLGNVDSFESCSHVAGRKMGRGAAKWEITQDDFRYSLQGTFSRASMSYVDEAPGPYKDVETVIAQQDDLVEIVHTFRPLMTVKADSRVKDD